jgi:hypothetical protein
MSTKPSQDERIQNSSFSPTSQGEADTVFVVGKKIVKMKHVASIEDHACSDNLKNREYNERENNKFRIKRNNYRSK